MIDNIDPSQLLPPNVRIPRAHIILYEIGLSLYKFDSNPVRSIINNPIIITIVFFCLFMKNVFLLRQYPEQNSNDFYLLLGHFGYFMDLSKQWEILELFIAFFRLYVTIDLFLKL